MNEIENQKDFLPEDNKYFKGYWYLCNEAKNRNLTKTLNDGNERHHIYPKSIYGNNNIIVVVNYKEHFLLHYMLWQGFKLKFGTSDKRTISMAFAFFAMSHITVINKRIKINSLKYSLIKQALCFKSEKHKKNIGIALHNFYSSPKNRKKLSIRTSGERNGMFGREIKESSKELQRIALAEYYTDDKKKEVSEKVQKRWDNVSAEGKKLHGEKTSGINNGNYDKGFYKIWVENFGQEIADKKMEEFKNKVIVNNYKKVYVYNEKYELISEYNNPEEVSKKYGIPVYTIRRCCRIGKIKNGLYYSYIKREMEHVI